MAEATQILSIKLTADTSDVNSQLKQVAELASAMGVAFQKVTQVIEAGSDQTVTDIKLIGNSVKTLEETFRNLTLAKDKLGKQLIQEPPEGVKNITAILYDRYETERRLQAERLANFNATQRELEARLSASMEIQRVEALRGSESLVAIKLREAEEIRQIETKLQEEILRIRKQFVAGDLSQGKAEYLQKINVARAGQAIQQAQEPAKEYILSQERSAAEIENEKRNVRILAELNKQKTKDFNEAAEARIKIAAGLAEQQKIIELNGSESLKALKHQEALDIIRIEEERNAKLLAIRQRYLAGELNREQMLASQNAIVASAQTKINTAGQPVVEYYKAEEYERELHAFITASEKRKAAEEAEYKLVERRLQETNARRERMVLEREQILYEIEQRETNRRLELNREYLRQYEQNTAAANEARIAQARADATAAFSITGKTSPEADAAEQKAMHEAAIKQEQERQKELTMLRQAEVENAKHTVVQLEAVQKQQIAAAQRAVDLERDIKISGADSATVALRRAANEEAIIKQNLSRTLAEINARDMSSMEARKQAEIDSTRAIAAAEEQLIAIQQNLPDTVLRNGQHIQTLSEHFKKLGTRILEVYVAWNALNTVSSLLSQAVHSIIPVGIALDSVKASLASTMGSMAGAQAGLQGLREEASRTGIQIGALRTSWATFQASTSLAGASLQDSWKMFTNLNTVITALHKTTDEANGIFLAMAQIFNKSKVQSEELVKQLGNLLPGAFASFAAANKMTTEQLYASMKEGSIKARDTMLAFTQFMSERFSASFALASQMLNADINRMTSSFQLLGETIYSSTGTILQSVVKNITSLVEYLTDAVKGVNNFGDTIRQVFDAGLALAIAKVLDITSKLKIFTGEVELATLAVKGFEASWAFIKANWLTAAIAAVTYAVMRHKEALDSVQEGYKSAIDIIKDYKKAMEAKVIEAAPLEIRASNTEEIKLADAKVRELSKNITEIEKKADQVRRTLGGKLIVPIDTQTLNDINTFVLKQGESLSTEKLQNLSTEERIELLKKLRDVILDISGKRYEASFIEGLEAEKKALQQRIDNTKASDENILEIHTKWLDAMGMKSEAKLNEINAKNQKLVASFVQAAKDSYNILFEDSLRKTKLLSEEQIALLQKTIQESIKAIGEAREVAAAESTKVQQELMIQEFNVRARELKVVNDAEMEKINSEIERVKKEAQNRLSELKSEEKMSKISPEEYTSQAMEIEAKKDAAVTALIEKQKTLNAEYQKSLETNMRLADIVSRVARSDIYHAVAIAESGGNLNAYNPEGGGLGARGLMQVRLPAWQAITGTGGEEFVRATAEKLQEVGEQYLEKMLREFKDVIISVSAYTKGPGTVENIYKKVGVPVGTTDAADTLKVQQELLRQYPELVNYQTKILNNMGLSKEFTKDQVNLIKAQADSTNYNNKLLEEQSEHLRRGKEIEAETVRLVREREKLYSSIDEILAQQSGKMEEAAAAKWNKDWDIKKAQITAYLTSPTPEVAEQAQVELDKLNRAKEFFLANQAFAQKDLEFKIKIKQTDEEEIRLNTERIAGYITQGEYTRQMNELKVEQLEIEKKQLEAINKQSLGIQQQKQLEQDLLDIKKRQQAAMAPLYNTIPAMAAGVQYKTDMDKLDFARNTAIQDANDKFAKGIISSREELNSRLDDIDTKYQMAKAYKTSEHYSNMMGIEEQYSSQLLSNTIQLYGKQSAAAKAAFMVDKAIKVAKAVMEAPKIVLNAYAAGAEVGGPILGGVFAAIAGAFAATQIAMIASAPMPSAHGGLEYVPKEETYLLDRGERVLSPKQNKDLTDMLTHYNKQQATQNVNNNNVRIVNVLDPSVVYDALAAPMGEKIVMNHVKANGG